MNTSYKCPNCGKMMEIECSPLRVHSIIKEKFVLVAVFLAGGWLLLDSGHAFWGGASLVAALITPTLHDFLTRYQRLLPIRARDARERETERLLEIARSEMSESPEE